MKDQLSTTLIASLVAALAFTAAAENSWMNLQELAADDGAAEAELTGVPGELVLYSVALAPAAYPATLTEVSFHYDAAAAGEPGVELAPVQLVLGQAAVDPVDGVLQGYRERQQLTYYPHPADAGTWVTVPVEHGLLREGVIVIGIELDYGLEPSTRAIVGMDTSSPMGRSFWQVRPTAPTTLDSSSDSDGNGTFDACEGLHQPLAIGNLLLRAAVSYEVTRGYNFSADSSNLLPPRCAEVNAPSWQLSLVPRRETVVQGEPIVCDATLTNTGTEPVSLREPMLGVGRTLLPKVSYGDEHFHGVHTSAPASSWMPGGGQPYYLELAPGDSLTTPVFFALLDLGTATPTDLVGTVYLRVDYANDGLELSSPVTPVEVLPLPPASEPARVALSRPYVVNMLQTDGAFGHLQLYEDAVFAELQTVINSSPELAPLGANLCIGRNLVNQARYYYHYPDSRSQDMRAVAAIHLGALDAAGSDFPLRATGRVFHAELLEMDGDCAGAVALANLVTSDSWATAEEVARMADLIARCNP